MYIRDKFTWTAVILGLAVNCHGEEAINMFYWMLRVFEAPDEVTFMVSSLHALMLAWSTKDETSFSA